MCSLPTTLPLLAFILDLGQSTAPLCEPCIIVDPVEPGVPDELSGVYRFLGVDPDCPGSCSYTRDGQGVDQVYCFGPGPRTGAFECAAQSSSPGGSTGGSQESSPSSSSSSSSPPSPSASSTFSEASSLQSSRAGLTSASIGPSSSPSSSFPPSPS